MVPLVVVPDDGERVQDVLGVVPVESVQVEHGRVEFCAELSATFGDPTKGGLGFTSGSVYCV